MPAGNPLVFEQQDEHPVVTITAKAEVAYFTGTVKDQDNRSVQDACVDIYRDREEGGALSYVTHTDSEGGYSVRVEHGSRTYCLSVSAVGYPDYMEDWAFQPCDDTLLPAPSGDIIMTNRLDFKAGQQATIILPEAPDPSWGRYYRLDRRNDEYAAVFVSESTPQANVPYVIFPEKDFRIDLSHYDYENLPEAGRLMYPDCDEDTPFGLFGTYQSRLAYSMYSSTVSLLDSTLDCQAGPSYSFPRVGAFRAYLVGYNTGSIYDDQPKLKFVEEYDAISEVPEYRPYTKQIFDIVGRKLNGIPQKGIYIQDGIKIVK